MRKRHVVSGLAPLSRAERKRIGVRDWLRWEIKSGVAWKDFGFMSGFRLVVRCYLYAAILALVAAILVPEKLVAYDGHVGGWADWTLIIWMVVFSRFMWWRAESRRIERLSARREISPPPPLAKRS